MTMPVYLSNAEYSHPPEEGPSLPVEGWFIPSIEMMKNKDQQGNQNQQPEHEDVLLQKQGNSWRNPLGVTQAIGFNSLRIPPPQNCKLQ